MMETGFYHTKRGYWQTTGEVDQRIRDRYPEGTIEVPLKPSARHEWREGKWVEVTPEPAPYVASDLSPRRFTYLLAFTGLGDVWDAIQADLKTRDRAQFAQLSAQRNAGSFSQVRTLAFVAMFRPVAAQVAPDIDLSDDAIKAAWIMAEGAEI
jgi:hypothetical protein